MSKMVISSGLYYSLTSGALASTASFFGKLSMSPSICCHLFNSGYQLSGVSNGGSNGGNDWCHSSHTSLALKTFQMFMFGAMIVTNLLMWTQFTKALKRYTNSLHVIVVNTSTNFFITAIYGSLFFGEVLSTLWWIGSTLIVIGLLIMKTSNSNELSANDKKKI